MGAKALRHRLPVSVRHYWKLVAGAIGLVAVLVLAVGTIRVSAVVTSDANEGFVITADVQNTVDLFDTSVAHEIGLEYSEDDYQQMIATFQDSGEKTWIKADITIDGVTVDDVGIRLKGNSTLASLGGGGEGAMGGRELPEGMEMPEGMEFPGGGELPEGMEFPGGGELPEDMEMPERGGGLGGTGGALSFDDPESLPWLVDFSKYIDGQVYQGNQQITLRVDSGAGGSTLTEAVALELVEAGGEPSYDWTYSKVSVNGSEAVTRRVVDAMDVTWAEEEYGPSEGVLYKGRAGGRFAYQGQDPGEYEDDFKQVTMEGSADMQPIIDFLEWLDAADDAAFDAELAEWVDVESFANYAALQNLIANGDDMSGPGGNYYLWYDYDTGLLSVITWDLDLALTSAELAPDESASIMGGGGGMGELPEGMEMPEGMEAPDGMEIPEGGAMPEGMGGMSSGAGEFKQRFLDSDVFQEVYMEAYADLFERLYASGAALEAVDTAAAAADLNGAADVAESAESLTSVIQQREEFLAVRLGAGG
ncbi:CotH kinase family protein [Glycomyces terrestris]|uniref:Spore coat protein CotH n=1 Tax=Glycomyces terrestris TaxID=2493553 RepID=A0A426V0S0_9ACTN|nr:CotH kinase family protein [Glycomyces terrestris]RRS00433.1 spore coat protein CotH [Glycomyces terrestris]